MIGDHQAAIDDFNAVIRMKPDDDRACFRRGWSYKSLGLYELAAEDFEKAKSINPRQKLYNLNYRLIGDIETIILLPPGKERKVLFDIEEDFFDDMSSSCSVSKRGSVVNLFDIKDEKDEGKVEDNNSIATSVLSGQTPKFLKPSRKSLLLNDM